MILRKLKAVTLKFLKLETEKSMFKSRSRFFSSTCMCLISNNNKSLIEVMEKFMCPSEPESYSGRATHSRQIKGERPDSGPLGLELR
jgi:hypothetical protein